MKGKHYIYGAEVRFVRLGFFWRTDVNGFWALGFSPRQAYCRLLDKVKKAFDGR